MDLQGGARTYSSEEYFLLFLGLILIALGFLILREYYRNLDYHR